MKRSVQSKPTVRSLQSVSHKSVAPSVKGSPQGMTAAGWKQMAISSDSDHEFTAALFVSGDKQFKT